MYLKIVPAKGHSAIVAVDSRWPITFGTWRPDPDKLIEDWSFAEEIVGDAHVQVDYMESLDLATIRDLQYAFRFAWWNGAEAIRLFVTAGDIYLLNDDGKTVDRA